MILPSIDVRRWAKAPYLSRIVLWGGLVLCIYAVWKLGPQSGGIWKQVSAWQVVVAAVLLAIIWSLTVAAWRQFARAFTGVRIAWPHAMRQSGLLLVGKYIPGTVFGFLARHHAMESNAPRAQALAAGVYEQIMGLTLPAALGALSYAAGLQRQPWLLVAVVVLPLAVAQGSGPFIKCLHGLLPFHRLRVILQPLAEVVPTRYPIFLGCTFAGLSMVGWMALAVAVGDALFGLDGYSALGIAGAFGIAASAGMLVIVAPGGVGAREAVFVALVAPWLDGVQAITLAAILRLLSVALDLAAGAIGGLAPRLGKCVLSPYKEPR